jgi:hypothetical protein
VLVDGAVKVGPPAGDLDVGFVHEPPIAGRMPRRASRSITSEVKVCSHTGRR